MDLLARGITFSILLSFLVSTGSLAAQESVSKRQELSNEAVSSQISSGQLLIRFNGRALDAAGQPLAGVAGVTFAIYAEQSGGAALWQETQNLATDEEGRFTAQLGANSAMGVPAELFSGDEARWMAVLANAPGVTEQPRVLLVSVPSSLTTNSQGLDGRAISDSAAINSQATTTNADRAVPVGTAIRSNPAPDTLYASGATVGYLPMFTDLLGDLQNSVILQANGNIGIGTSPDQALTVKGAVHSTTGGFIFPDGSVMTTAVGGGSSAPAPKAMTGAVPTANLFSLHIPAGEAAGGRVKFTIVASDGTNYAMETGEMTFLASPQQLICAVVISEYSKTPPSYTNGVLAIPAIGQPGSLNAQCNSTYFGSDPGVQIVDNVPGFTPTTHKVYYSIENQSQAVVTLQP